MKFRATFLLLATLVLLSSMNSDDPPLLAQEVNSADSFFESMQTNRQWSSYRGYFASGYLDNALLPDSFNIEIPGLGLSCPVIWDDKVFITTAISSQDTEGYKTGLYGDIEPVADSSEHVWKVYCFDKKSGNKLCRSGGIPNPLMPTLPLPQMVLV